MKMVTAAGRRYTRRLLPTMVAYVVVLFGCILAIRHWHPTGAALAALSVLPALPILAALGVMGLYLLEETDEYLRGRIAACMLAGTGVLLAVTTVYGFLVDGGAIEPWREAGLWGFPIWCGSWGIAQCLLSIRDRLQDRRA